jgi:intracellular sulfur oxidation DsrE/DsrF family protein
MAWLLFLAWGVHAQAGDYAKQKVVYHINTGDPQVLRSALGNIQNHLAAVGPGDVEIKVVIHGDGLNLLRVARTDREMQGKILGLKAQKVEFKVCNNSMRTQHIDYHKDLFDVHEADVVPSGVAELARLQQQGYLYIKP